MPIEKEGFRDALERLDAAFPNEELISIKETASFLGCSENSVRKHIIPQTKLGIAKVIIAKFMIS